MMLGKHFFAVFHGFITASKDSGLHQVERPVVVFCFNDAGVDFFCLERVCEHVGICLDAECA